MTLLLPDSLWWKVGLHFIAVTAFPFHSFTVNLSLTIDWWFRFLITMTCELLEGRKRHMICQEDPLPEILRLLSSFASCNSGRGRMAALHVQVYTITLLVSVWFGCAHKATHALRPFFGLLCVPICFIPPVVPCRWQSTASYITNLIIVAWFHKGIYLAMKFEFS
jgi:hypothetical protein